MTFFSNGIFFSSTIAQDYDKFWVGETSDVIKVVERDQAIPNNGISTTRLPIATTTPNFVRSTASPKKDDGIYDGCGDTKTCFGSPDGCVASKSCQTFSAIIVRGKITYGILIDIKQVIFLFATCFHR